MNIPGLPDQGASVLIVQDCRNPLCTDHPDVSGQIAIYEGMYCPICPEGTDCHHSYNPRMRLPDNTVIWGYECWWKTVDPNKEIILEKEQQKLARFLEGLRALMEFDQGGKDGL